MEILAPDVYEVEFCDDQGRAYAFASLHAEQLLVITQSGQGERGDIGPYPPRGSVVSSTAPHTVLHLTAYSTENDKESFHER